MATTMVKKGAGRPAAAERTARHSQRTPLPPKTEQASTKPIGGHAETAKILSEKGTPVGDDAVEKARSFTTDARALGWRSSPLLKQGDNPLGDQYRGLKVSRGSEVITIYWEGRRFVDDCWYSNGERSVKLRNASAARGVMSRSVEVAAIDNAKVTRRKAEPRKGETTVQVGTKTRSRRVPFELDADPDEIIEALLGKRITWLQGNGNPDSARLMNKPGQRTLRITEKDGRRTLHFPEAGAGSRSIYLDALISVTK